MDETTMNQKIRTYSELVSLKTFLERFNYLKLDGSIGVATFGFDRYLNQALYRSREWKSVRDSVILRDYGCDLGIKDREIYGKIIIHHMNPLSERDILDRNPDIFNPEFLICTTINTHNAIHYSNEDILVKAPIERKANDTRLW